MLTVTGRRATRARIEKEDDEWIGAVSLINSADLKVRKVGRTLGRAMEELSKQGPIGLESDAS